MGTTTLLHAVTFGLGGPRGQRAVHMPIGGQVVHPAVLHVSRPYLAHTTTSCCFIPRRKNSTGWKPNTTVAGNPAALTKTPPAGSFARMRR